MPCERGVAFMALLLSCCRRVTVTKFGLIRRDKAAEIASMSRGRLLFRISWKCIIAKACCALWKTDYKL